MRLVHPDHGGEVDGGLQGRPRPRRGPPHPDRRRARAGRRLGQDGRRTLLLFPGAGATREQPALRAVDAAVSAMQGLGDGARRLPVPQGRPRAPDRSAGADGRRARGAGGDRTRRRTSSSAAARWAGASARWSPPAPTASLRRAGCSAVVTIAYPLHPPGRPDRLRVEHLPAVTVPWLFVHGTKDPFGTSRRTAAVDVRRSAGPVTHHWVEGKGHDLKGADADVAAVVQRLAGRARVGRPGEPSVGRESPTSRRSAGGATGTCAVLADCGTAR